MKIKVVAAIVDTRQLTLYREDGETIIIKQGDPRLRAILDQATPQIISQGYAEIDLSAGDTGYQQFEKQSGVVRFFKVAREKLKDLFAPHVEAAAVGKKPSQAEEFAQQKAKVYPEFDVDEGGRIVGYKQLQEKQAVIDEIIANAVPVSHPDFNTENLLQQGNIAEEDGSTDSQRKEAKTTHTIVAHVDGKLIPDMERIETHFIRASKLGSPIGVELFLKRAAKVIDQRSHSIEDLLKFMERSDMPIAEDGSIIIYKVLRRHKDHYVDCHTGNVPQKVGSFVCMDISLVDRVRDNECSNGLHVARRGYISGFVGDVCTVAKLAPEDVVTVPSYDANKMRVMGYHILHELSQKLYDLLRQNKPITDEVTGRNLLGQLLAGNHVGRLEEVRITSANGGGVVVTPIVAEDIPVIAGSISPLQPVIERVNAGRVARGAKPIPAEALKNPKREKEDAPVNPKDVAKKVTSLSRKDQAQVLYKAYQKKPSAKNKAVLIAFKKQVKLGWKALGIDEKFD